MANVSGTKQTIYLDSSTPVGGGWSVRSGSGYVKITKPGGMVALTLAPHAAEAVFKGLQAIYGSTSEAVLVRAEVHGHPGFWSKLKRWFAK